MSNLPTCGPAVNDYNDTYIYVSDAWGSQSWLDHCISTEGGNDIITNAHVVYESIQSDHLPVVFELDLR